jgi:hypothetical protein
MFEGMVRKLDRIAFNVYVSRIMNLPCHNLSFHPAVKLFDFGLARFMPESGDPTIDVFDMSGAGTPR